MRVQRQQAFRGGPGAPFAAAPASLLVVVVLPLLLGQVGQLALPLLLEEAPLGDVVFAAQGEAAEGGLQVPAPGGPGGPDGPSVGVVRPVDGEMEGERERAGGGTGLRCH